MKGAAPQTDLLVRGAREHNLQGVDVRIPRGSLTTVTGVSGSGKSSLAFDTIFKEGQRRFVESLSAYARQFLGQGEKPRLDHIEGLSPTVSIDQKTVSRNPRSTVGTVTEILDHLRLLFARLGTPHCPDCGTVVRPQTPDEIIDRILSDFDGRKLLILATIVRDRKGEYRKELEELRGQGFVRARIDGVVHRLDEPIELARYERHTVAAVLDRLAIKDGVRGRLAEAVERGLEMGHGVLELLDGEELHSFSTLRACPDCGSSIPELEPRSFSFNSPWGACKRCSGLGISEQVDLDLIVPDPELSIDEGAILPSQKGGWMLKKRMRPEILAQVCDALRIPRDRPFRKLSGPQSERLLQGAPGKKIDIELDLEGRRYRYTSKEEIVWEGVLPIIEETHAAKPGRGTRRYLAPSTCRACDGMRLSKRALAVRFRERSIGELSRMTVEELLDFLQGVSLDGRENEIGARLFKELRVRLEFLARVGVGYLGIERSAATLSGGEAQRIRLATQVGSRLRGILYVLDEPSIGLHQRDNQKLIEILRELRDSGNTVLVVEHDEETIEASDHVIDVGPLAGVGGGQIVAEGTPAAIRRCKGSVTGAFLSGRESIPVPETPRKPERGFIEVLGARAHNLKDLDARLPIGLFTAVTGVSGSGKSTLVDRILKRVLARSFHGAQEAPGEHRRVKGLEHLDKVIEIDQSPIGRTPRSNPATYTKLFDLVRDLFASLPESQVRGYGKGRFSFNVKGGRCEECGGAGVRLIEMQFLSDVAVPCESCEGRRFNPETLEIHYRGRSINDVLEMSVDEGAEFFANHRKLAHILQTLQRVGLGYVRLGQPSTTLSGGEAQRVKLAKYLHRPPTGRTLYLLDEPTTGLHFLDVRRLIEALQGLVDQGNTVVVVEHNLDVIKSADWIVDLGPEGGVGGGTLVYEGAVAGLLKKGEGATATALRAHLDGTAVTFTKGRRAKPKDRSLEGEIAIDGASLHNLKNVDLRIPAGTLSVITGPSGSGKTSLAFDTLFAEGQRRFVECLSTYARQFLGRVDRPPFEDIRGLAPAIAIDQKNASRNPRSTVATVTEIQDYLRLLFARVGTLHCPDCGERMLGYTPDRVVASLLEDHAGAKGRILAPLYRQDSSFHSLLRKPNELRKLLPRLEEDGFRRVLLDGEEHLLDEKLPALTKVEEIWLVVDRVSITSRSRTRLLDSVGQAFDRGLGVLAFRDLDGNESRYSELPSCLRCEFHLESELTPRHFSFNSHVGACSQCQGLGVSLRCDPELLVGDPSRPLFKKALSGRPGDFISRRDSYLRKIVERIAKARGIKLSQPWSELPDDFRKVVLEGQEDEVEISFQSKNAKKKSSWQRSMRWKGFCRYIEEWFANSTSESWSESLAELMRRDHCSGCDGERLKAIPRAVRVGEHSIGDLGRMSVEDAFRWADELELEASRGLIAEEILKELGHRLGFLSSVGLGYLGLDRSAGTLSGGEAQRIRLATQIGNRLTGVIYVLDEPTIGLHPRDTDRLLGTLEELRDLGNSVVVVEHDRDTIGRADWVVDMGPGAGRGGGEIVYQGKRSGLLKARGLTADYLAGRLRINEEREPRAIKKNGLRLKGVRKNNLKGIDVEFPHGALTVVTGVSGSGKSSLVMDSLVPAMQAKLKRKPSAAELGKLSGFSGYDKVIVVDQNPIGSSPRSNPASYIGILDELREIMARTPLAKMRGYKPGRFSFNRGEGRCAACEGRGSVKIEMHFLPDVWIVCDSCDGKRFNRETLEVKHRERSIADILEMEVSEALVFFENHPRVRATLQVTEDVGLGYLQLGQSATTLSGGEAQRIKLAKELRTRKSGRILYVLDEPTTGLHFDDVARLVRVIHGLVDAGHTAVIIEHNGDVVSGADWIIDLGPEGGEGGGQIVASGRPEEIAACSASWTGRHL